MKIRSYAASDCGRVRKTNEDRFLVNNRLGLFAVADGMGGHRGGETASQMALDILSAEVAKRQKLLETYAYGPTPALKNQILEALREALQKANQRIIETAGCEETKKGMGTTLSAVLVAGNSVFLAHAGDSRIYLFREGESHRLTEDHTLLNEQLKRGLLTPEEAGNVPEHRKVVTRALGISPAVAADTLHLQVLPGDRLLLCTDGLYDSVSDQEITAMFDRQFLEEISQRLITLANERGGADNVATVVVEIPPIAFGGEGVELGDQFKELRKIPLFERLSHSELLKVLNVAQMESRKRGDFILREGEASDRLFILLNGSADVMKGNVYQAARSRGAHFGELSTALGDPALLTVRASSPCDFLVIERNDFLHLLHEEPHLSIKFLMCFLAEISRQLRETQETLPDRLTREMSAIRGA